MSLKLFSASLGILPQSLNGILAVGQNDYVSDHVPGCQYRQCLRMKYTGISCKIVCLGYIVRTQENFAPTLQTILDLSAGNIVL